MQTVIPAGTTICVATHEGLLTTATVNREATTDAIEADAKRDGYRVVAWNVEVAS